MKEDDVNLIREFRAQLETSAFRIAEAMYAGVEADSDGFDETVPSGEDDPEENGDSGPIEA